MAGLAHHGHGIKPAIQLTNLKIAHPNSFATGKTFGGLSRSAIGAKSSFGRRALDHLLKVMLTGGQVFDIHHQSTGCPMNVDLAMLKAQLAQFGLVLPERWSSPVYASGKWTGAYFNVPAFLVVMILSWLLVRGVRESAETNNVMVAVKVGAILIFLVVGGMLIRPANWHPFAPSGFAGVVTGGNWLNAADAYSAAMFYVVVYVLTTLGTFGMVLLLSRAGFEAENLDDFKGLNARNPWYAFIMLLLMFSMAGIPPTVGFVAKFLVIQPVLDAGFAWLAVVLALNAVLAAFYYLRVVVHMYMYDPEGALPPIISPRLLSFSLAVSAIAVVVLGIVPNTLYQWALNAAGPILP